MKNKLIIIILILIGLLTLKSLFHSGFYTSHDGRHQIIRLMHFHQGLVDGQFPVRWAGTALKGYGYPLFIYTYRLPFWIAEGWYAVFHNLGDAIKFSFILTYVLSGISMYFLASKVWSSKLAGFLSAFLYIWAPYRFVNVFVRASLGEATTFVFFPLIFLGIFNLAKNKKQLQFTIFTAFSIAGLILSHAITLSLWLIPLILWIIYYYQETKNKKDYFASLILSGVLSLFLTAYYWLPAMIEKKYTRINLAIGDYFKAHFVTLKQLVYSRWGYGFSMPGTQDDMMSFQIGFAGWLVVVTALIIFLISYLLKSLKFKNLKKIKKIFDKHFKLNKKEIKLMVYLVIIFLISIYFMLSYSSWLYKIINLVFTIDIPWRFLGVSVFVSSLLFGGLIRVFKQKFFKTGFILIILFLTLYSNRNHLRVNKYVYTKDNEYWQSTESSNEYDDYTPEKIDVIMLEEKDPQLYTAEGASNNKVVKRKSNLFRFYSEVKSDKADIVTKVAYYPGWKVLVDGQEQEVTLKGGKINLKLGKGNHLITLIFQETRLRHFSNILSFVTFIAILFVVIKKRKVL